MRELTVQTCRSTSQPRSRPILKNSLSFCDSTRTLTSFAVNHSSIGTRRHRSCLRHNPALHDRIAGVDRLVGPDEPRDTVPRRDAPFHDFAEEIADLGDRLLRADGVTDPD